MTGLVWAVGNRLAQHESALQWGKTALALARRPEVEAEVEALAWLGLGCVLADQGRVEAALDHFERALAIRERALGPRHPKVAVVLDFIGRVQLHLGKPKEDALAPMQRALAIREEVLGPHHPETASSLSGMGGVLLSRGHTAEALTYLQRAMAINEVALVPHHPNVTQTIYSLGDVLWMQGQRGEALTYYAQSLARIEEAVGPHHPDVAYPLVAMARVSLEMDDPATAHRHAERAVSILESAETSPARVSQARFLLARALWLDETERARARALAEQARSAYVELGGSVIQGVEQVDAWLAEHPL